MARMKKKKACSRWEFTDNKRWGSKGWYKECGVSTPGLARRCSILKRSHSPRYEFHCEEIYISKAGKRNNPQYAYDVESDWGGMRNSLADAKDSADKYLAKV